MSLVPIIGQVYHPYRRENEDESVSMIGPEDFGAYYHEYVRSYRPETDSVQYKLGAKTSDLLTF